MNTLNSNTTLTAQQVSLLTVRSSQGDSLINPLTTPGNNKDWDVPSFGIIDPANIFTVNIGGRTRCASRNRTSSDLQVISRLIEVDQSSIYEVRISLLKTLNHGYVYFGLYESSDGLGLANTVGPETIVNRAIFSGADPNPYFFYTGAFQANHSSTLFAANTWFDMVFYVCGRDAPINRVPNATINGINPRVTAVTGVVPQTFADGFRLSSAARFFSLRFLNFYNTVQTDLYANNVSVRRVFGRDAGIDQEIADRTAAVSSEQTARVNGDNALAQSISSVSTTVGGNSASINTLTSSVNGLNAQYVIQLDNNGRISGLKLAGSNTFASFSIVADQFSISFPGAPGVVTVPFTVGTVGGVPTVGINGNLVVDGTIVTRTLLDQGVTTPKMAPGSVTNVVNSAGGSGFVPNNTTTSINLTGISVTDFSSIIIIDWNLSISHQVNNDPAGKLTIGFNIYINGGLTFAPTYGLNSRNFRDEVYPGYTRRFTLGPGYPPGTFIQAQIVISAGAAGTEFIYVSSNILMMDQKR